MKSKLAQFFGRFLFEFITIVMAVLLSFSINSWQLEREDREAERELLHQIHSNLKADTTILHRNIFMSKRLIETYDQVLQIDGPERIDADSIDRQLDYVITYTKFKATRVGYVEMQQTGSSRLVRNKALLNQIISLYDYWYDYVEEWNKIDSDHILTTLIPYVDQHFPYSEWTAYDDMLRSNPDRLVQVLKADHFKNLVRTNKLFKEAALGSYELILDKINKLLEAIEQEVGEIEK